MITEDDKKVLDTMDVKTVEQLMLKVESFIKEADKLLIAFPVVDYNNVFETALQSESIANSLKDYSDRVWNTFNDIFSDNQPSAQRNFGKARMLVPQAISEYGTLLNTLKKKRDILVEFQSDLKSYLDN